MGLRNRALKYRENIEDLSYADNIIGSQSGDRVKLRKEGKDRQDSLRMELDRKLLDMQTLFEIGKEINSTLRLQEQIQIIIFTLMGQFRISDIAVYSISGKRAFLIEKKGFSGLNELEIEERSGHFLNNLNHSAPIKEITDYSYLYKELERNNAALIAPVKNKDRLTGLIITGKKSGGEVYSPDDGNFLFTLASLSGVAIENSRLYGELEETNIKLKTKLSELSTLYEISKVINSSGDYQAILNLITETITTGFGVKKALLTLIEGARPVVRQVIGLNDSLLNQPLDILPDEEKLFLENRAGIVSAPDRIKNTGISESSYLFMPLVSSGTKIGAILIFNFEKYPINSDNPDFINLFSIIASQIAPPLALAKQLHINSELEEKPYDTLINMLQKEIERARQYGVTIHLAILKLKNISKLISRSGDITALDKISELQDKITSLIPNTAKVIKYSSDRILIVLPEIFGSDLNEIKRSVKSLTRGLFKNNYGINIGAEISMVDCSDERKSLLSLLCSTE
jgi:GGDEF domain-containing protein